MSTNNPLKEAFLQAKYRLGGHGKRNIQQLKTAINHVDENLDSDVYGSGELIEGFQDKMSQYVGKEAAVFFPSGTMAQQIAMRIWCDRKGLKKVAYHPLCHLEIHEEDGLKELHQIESILLADKNRVITLEDVLNLNEDIACLLLELPQREIGGQLPSYEELEAIAAHCHKKGIPLHLDGARLFEILPYYQKSAEEICQLFDSVYLSFYKGIGGIAGAILAGDEAFIKESKIWKRRHGGDLISLYPYIISADHYFEQNVHKMGQFYSDAKELAEMFNQCHGIVTLPVEPVSNMFHVHFHAPKEKVEPMLISIYESTGIGFTQYLKECDENGCSYEVSIGNQYALIPKEELQHAFYLLAENMRQVLA
ncbi:threonine aldolase family protein [Brevibacillus sp. SYSU BS000544]|uniref:threonine aldolase family protein n=1 Tax=Brevibacillus sp. SYSU BS000544 TaxID=3416443 RepID=UPI003CE4E727